jgi:hypothetical protein
MSAAHRTAVSALWERSVATRILLTTGAPFRTAPAF